MEKIMKQTSFLPILIADGLALLGYVLLLPLLSHWLMVRSGLNVLLLLLLYGFFWWGVYRLRQLETAVPETAVPSLWRWLLSPATRGVLAVLFALGLMTAISYELGYFDAIQIAKLGEGESAAFFVLAPGAWLSIALLYVPALAFSVRPAIAVASSRYNQASLLGLVAVNLLLIQAIALFRVSVGSAWYWWPLILLALGVWFGPPRLLYAAKQPGNGRWQALAPFILLLLVGSWLALP